VTTRGRRKWGRGAPRGAQEEGAVCPSSHAYMDTWGHVVYMLFSLIFIIVYLLCRNKIKDQKI